MTRDEAIAIVKAPRSVRFENADGTRQEAPAHRNEEIWALGYDAGMRDALEALAAAGVFSDSDPCPWCEANREVTPDPGSSCETCDGSGRLRTMADKLDAAGIL